MYKLFGKSKPSNETKTKTKLECPICMDKKIDTCMVSCGHTFCEKCIFESILRIPVNYVKLVLPNL